MARAPVDAGTPVVCLRACRRQRGKGAAFNVIRQDATLRFDLLLALEIRWQGRRLQHPLVTHLEVRRRVRAVHVVAHRVYPDADVFGCFRDGEVEFLHGYPLTYVPAVASAARLPSRSRLNQLVRLLFCCTIEFAQRQFDGS